MSCLDRILCLSYCTVLVFAKFDDSGFLSWFEGELREVNDVKLKFDGDVPDYIRGYIVQGGPGAFGMGDYTMTHAFDGFAKIQRLNFGADGVTYTSKFLQSDFYTASNKSNKIVWAMLAGDTVPSQGFGPKGALAGHNDNNDVKCQKLGNEEMCFSDTSVATVLKDDFETFDHVIRPSIMGLGTNGTPWHDKADVFAHICATGVMAHGRTNPLSGNFVAAIACISPLEDAEPYDYHVVFEIDPMAPDVRKVIKTIKLGWGRKASYMHSMGHTDNYALLIAEPLHMSVTALFKGKALSEGGLVLGNGTIFQAVKLSDGSLREWHHPSFQFAHIFNSWEDGDDIVLDLTWYESDWHMMYFGQFQFKNLEKEVRDTWPVNKVVRYRLKGDGTVQETNLLPNDPESQFELPVVDPRVQWKKEACVTWFTQAKSNPYDEEQNSTRVGPSGAYAVAKRNTCTGERLGWYAPNEYPNEVSFVPNPKGSEEDDGALVGVVYDANKNSSYVQIWDARTMNVIARADLPIKVPFAVHATWIAEDTDEKQILV